MAARSPKTAEPPQKTASEAEEQPLTEAELQELEWVCQARDGDRDAFGRLVELYQRRAVAVSYRLLGKIDDALEITQDAFLRAYKNIATLEAPGAFGSWLLRIVCNLSLNYRRSRKRSSQMPLEELLTSEGDLAGIADSGPEVSRVAPPPVAVVGMDSGGICRLLSLEPSHRVLDLCGGHGRHTLEFCARGFRRCTLLDYSQNLVDTARASAEADGYPVEALQADARHTGLPSDYFDTVLILGNSLGYIDEPDADHRILREAERVLRPGGRLLVDVSDGEAVTGRFIPVSWHEIGNDTVVCRQRELRQGAVAAREIVLSKRDGLIRDCTYAIRLYDADSLHRTLARAGFDGIDIHADFSFLDTNADYGFMNHRMLGCGIKPTAGTTGS